MKKGIRVKERSDKHKRVQEQTCDSCGTGMTTRMYRKNEGFCKACYKLYFD